MRFTKLISILIVLIPITMLVPSAFCAEIDGWIKSETCWVVKSPSTDSLIVGIILKKAAVTVTDAGNGWLKIVFAPVRNPTTWKFIDCTGCYIQKKNLTTVLGQW